MSKRSKLGEKEKLPAPIFTGPAKKGEVRNPAGRPKGSKNKGMPDYRKVKHGLLQCFMKSRAPAIIYSMLNMKLPEQLLPHNLGTITPQQEMALRELLLKNFKWAVEQCIKALPKELGVFGKLQQEHTLSGMVRRAEESPKSDAAISLVEKQTENGITSYEVPEEEK